MWIYDLNTGSWQALSIQNISYQLFLHSIEGIKGATPTILVASLVANAGDIFNFIIYMNPY
jgi:hypothetical protein